jgi:hypothetical protein
MSKDWGRALLLTPIIIGILLLVGGIVWYAILSTQINNNIAYQIRSENQQIDPQSQAEALGLVSASEQLRDLGHNRDLATIMGGVGLVLIAAGWLARDFVVSREQKVGAEAENGKVKQRS